MIGNDKVKTKYCNVMCSTLYQTFITKPNKQKSGQILPSPADKWIHLDTCRAEDEKLFAIHNSDTG